MSPDFKSGLAFGVVMVVIGLAAVWVVRWQTYFTIRHQGQLPYRYLFPVGGHPAAGNSLILRPARQDHSMNLPTPSNPGHEEAASSDVPAVVLDTTANLPHGPETPYEVFIATLAVRSPDTAMDG